MTSSSFVYPILVFLTYIMKMKTIKILLVHLLLAITVNTDDSKDMSEVCEENGGCTEDGMDSIYISIIIQLPMIYCSTFIAENTFYMYSVLYVEKDKIW